MSSRYVRPLALVLVAALGAACTGDGDDATAAPTIVQPGAPGEPSRTLSPDEVPELDLAHSEADVAFVQGMIPHHVQALRMTRLVPDRTDREDLPLFAERMDISQEDEIELMRRWLEARDEEVPPLSADHEHAGVEAGELMPGMLTEEELAELEAAEGEAFDELFLRAMIRHHQGAIAMVDQLVADGGGNEPEVSQLARHIRSDQEIEIARMERMLAELG